MEGTWGRSKWSEKEFNFKSVCLDIPTDPRALLHYAASITKGIGLSVESDIWAAFGEDWQNHPDLEGIARLNETKRFAWQDTLTRIKDGKYMAQCMAYLLEHGCTMNMATAAWNLWADESLGMVKADCYCLTELPNYGFVHIDDMVRGHFEIGDDDPRRLDACILYQMKQALGTGSTLVLWEEVRKPVLDYIASAKGRFQEAIKRLIDNGKILRIEDSLGIDVYLAIPKNYEDELKIWEWTKEL